MIQYIFLALLGWGIVAPVTTYFWQKGETVIKVYQAKTKATKAAQEQCKIDMQYVQDKAKDETAKRVEEALKSAKSFKLPDDLTKLCRKSASCREHNSF